MEMSGELDSDGSTALLQNRPVWMEFGGRMAPGRGTGTCQVYEGASILAIRLRQHLSRLAQRLQQVGSSQTSCQIINGLENIY